MNKSVIFLLIATGILFFACNNNSKSPESTTDISGEQLFKINCAQCHRPSEDLTGPALKNVAGRWENKMLLYEFIKAPQEVIANDPYAKNLFVKWKQAYMQPFPNLTNEEIDSVLNYCNMVQE